MRDLARRRTALRAAGALVALAAGLLLGGCAAIPGDGPVEVGLEDFSQAEQVWQYNPAGPAVGASKEDLVLGFLIAGTSPLDDYAVAREFLTPGYSSQWDPYYGVLVTEGSRPYRSDGDEAGVLSLAAVAKVDAQGIMLPVQPGPTTEMRFEFERVGDEWRIASAPAGIILSSTEFTSIWSQHQLYFVGPGNVLVPDTRWYLTRSALPTEIVSALLDGPGERLREVVRTGFPTGTELAGSTVQVVDGIASIELTDTIFEAGSAALAEVRQQVKMSLQSVSGVNGFELLVDGTPLRETSGSEDETPQLVKDISDPIVMIGDEFGTFSSGEFKAMDGFAQSLAGYDPQQVSFAPNGEAAAVLNDGGVALVDADGALRVDDRSGLLAPVFDRLGCVWTVQGSDAKTLRITAPDGTATTIKAPWLAGREPVALRVSPEGARVAALVSADDGSQVLVAGVVRDERGVPIATTEEAETQLWVTGDPIDLDWMGQQRFVALTGAEGAGNVTIGGLGQFAVKQGSVPGGRQVAGGGMRTQLWVLGDGQDLFAPQNSGWQRSEGDISLLAKRG
ncbi:MAG: LpqB family beta-propeller domain-containing protein [Leucobacter sp.]